MASSSTKCHQSTNQVSPSSLYRRHVLNAFERALSSELFAVVDLSEHIPHLTLSESERSELWSDLLHLTPKGYDMMADVIFAQVFAPKDE